MTDEFELETPEGFAVYRGVQGVDLMVVVGAPLGDRSATVISVDADGPATTREEYVARMRAQFEREFDPHLVDQAPVPLAGLEAWWTVDALVRDGRSLIRDSWMLVRRGIGYTAAVEMPWQDVRRLRDGAIAIVSTLRFR